MNKVKLIVERLGEEDVLLAEMGMATIPLKGEILTIYHSFENREYIVDKRRWVVGLHPTHKDSICELFLHEF